MTLGVALVLCHLLLRTCGLQPSLRIARRLVLPCHVVLAGTTPNRRDADELGRRIAAAGRRRWVRAACLPQALLLWLMLGAEGHAVELVIGVGGSLRCFRAHAWVELDGRPVAQLDSSLEAFRELSRTALVVDRGRCDQTRVGMSGATQAARLTDR